MSSSLEKIPQNPPISLALRPETIRHPDKRSKLENDATCGLGAGGKGQRLAGLSKRLSGGGVAGQIMKNIYLEKAKRTIRSHSWGYANTWGITPKNLAYYRSTGKPYTGIFAKDYNCTVEALANSFECENCPICGRSYASIAEGRKGVAGNPLWHKTFHIWFPDWIVVCRSCHSKITLFPQGLKAAPVILY